MPSKQLLPPESLRPVAADGRQGQFAKETQDLGCTERETPPQPIVPVTYLMTWVEILNALNLSNTFENKRRVRDANLLFDGPIIPPSKGSQPRVNKAKLLEWWNGLEDRFREIKQNQVDKQATVQEQYKYAKDGTVAPGIAGHVRKRRAKHGGR